MIREHGYTHWDGQLRERRFPWWPITRLNLKLAFRKKHFRPVYALSFLPAFFFIVAIYISERIEDFRFMMRGGRLILFEVNPSFFKNYLAGDFLFFMLVLIMVFAGAGLVADDFRFNALPLYFSRPLRKKDYLLGKAAVIAFFVLTLTVFPAIIFIIFKLLFSGSFVFLRNYPWISLSIIGYSLFLTLFFCFYTLFLSCLSRNSRYVSVIIFAVYLFSDFLYVFLYNWFRQPLLALISIKLNLQQIASFAFGVKAAQPFSWIWSFLVICAFCGVAGYFIIRKIRAVEVIR
ncbi:MAG: ABC transporter permease [Candidatus Aminicenantes bacterium]|nr:ABC transporter permease [Candidatus Aminicenantes bacterium]